MSTFFSNKYLKYRRMLERVEPAIDKDVPCANCGYNIRGLRPGKPCPECGKPIPFDFETAADPLLSGDHNRRAMTQWGLTLMFGAVLAFIIARLGFSTLWAIAKWPPPGPYLGTATVIASAWAIGVWLGTPSSLDVRRRARAPLRWLARLTQLLWVPAVALPFAAHVSGKWLIYQDEIAMWSGLFSACAAMGWLVLAFVLHQAADDLELDDAPRRIGMAIWTVPPLTALLMLVPLRTFFITLALIAPFMLAWAWYLFNFARGVWELRQYVAWGVKQVTEVGDRESRIAAKKAELDAIAQSRIRDMPPRPHAPPTEPGAMPKRPFLG